MFEPIIINLDYSPRDERHSEQTKSIGSRIGKRIGSGLVDRPNIGKNRRTIGSGRIDIPTGGARGYKKPTGSRLDIDRDGWADEGTTNPVWVGLSSGQDRSRPVIETQRARPKINLINQKINERKKIRQKIKYGENSLDGKLVSRKNGSKWLDGLSNEQISNILVPDSYQTYSEMLADGFGVDKGTIEKYLESRWGVGKPWLEIDYSEKSTKELRQALQSTLDESPIFSWAVRNYGSPTYAVMTRKSAETYNNRDAVKPLYDALKKIYPDAPGEPQFAASNHLDFEMVTFNPVNVIDKKSWQTSEPISTSFQTSKLPSDSDTVIDRSISGTILHEWAHWYHSEMLLANIESTESKKRSPKSLINPQDSDFTEKIQIALEYNSDNGNMNLHLTKKPLEDSPNEPRTITSYGHVSKKEMFAEGMLAYMHPNEQLKLKAINKKLRQDIETILVGDKGIDAWKDSKANIKREKNILSSGRKNRKLTKLSSGSKTEKTEKPKYPRHPSYGPFLDGADDVFTNVKNWEEFKEVYNNLEINFFDYETTGLVSDEFQQSSGNGAPVQFGVTKTKGGKEIGRLNIFMNPGEELGDWSRKNLKDKDGKPLTDEWLSSQISIAEAHKKLIEFVGPDAIFGVQNAVFDKTVLEDALNSSDIEWRPKGWVDTKVVSDLVIPKWTKENQDAPWTIDKETGEKIPSNSLKALTEYLDINLGKKHHTADADAAATSELMSKIIDKAIEKNWSNDIFDKNWRDQKIKNKLENHQQKIIDFEQQKNNWISETSPKKSTVPKETEEKKFGFGKLSSGTTSYKGRHESPDASNGAPLYNLANGAIYPEDIYGPNGANLYGGAFPDLAQKAVAIFRKLRNKPDSELTVYRAVPRGKKIKEGDWVTILPEYAKIHGDSWLKNDYEIATKKVKAKELFNEGNSLLEFGYHSKLSSGKYDGAPTYKGKVWKDRKNELDAPVWPFPSQSKQYPKDGPPGISYFKGVVNESTWVDCLLYRDNSGKLIGILNHYPFALVDPDDPRIVERRGNFNIFIDPKHKGKGIGTKLVDEAVSRYNVDLRRQRYSEEGADFINNYIRKLPENKNKPKLSSGATEITPVERKEIADKQLSVKLSALDIEAIGNWNGYLFKDINDYLRNNNSGNQELAEGVVSAFERISVPVPADLVLWRGIRASQGEARAYRVGDTLQDDGFQSATFKKRIATQFNSPRSINDEWEAVVFEINAKKGTKVVDIQSLVEKLDLASDAEDEILLQNGTQYKVAKIERNINQNEWAGIDDTSFKGEKITVITVDVIKNSDKDSRLSSGSTPASKMAEQRIQRRIAAYKERAEKGDGSELRLPWDENGKLKETPIIVSEEDDDFDDDEEFSKEEKENRAAVLEYSKISPEEMEERIRRAEESKRRLNSPEYLEQSRLRRVARNKGKETNTHNADGTLKEKKGEKLSSGSLINSEKYRKKHTALLKKILTRMDKEGAGWTDEDMRLARLDELEYNFGKSLRQTIEYWYGGAFDVTYNMRDEIESGKISKEVNELLSIIDISPVTSRPIWRGMRYMTQDELDEIINRGVTLPLGAFSGQKSTAISYADGGYSNNSQVSVILRLERGVKAFPMKHFSPIDEEEYLVAGTFEVVSVSQTRVGRFGETVTEVELRSLSSGGQPRMNLSDEEKREIIAIASQRTDDFSKSVVAQFRRNGRLSDKQWNALNKATLRRSRLSSGKTNRANRRANSSKLSSGSQPRMNLSDEEKREIIAIASQRTDDFSKSVVAQFRRNGKLSDRQWNALNRATLRRSRLSSGAIGVEEFKNMSDAKHAQILSEAGLSQRGEAEDAGQVISEKGFVGLYQYALEHIGDLYHRAQHRLKYSAYGLDEVDEKITKILRYLRQPYGFEREVKEQIDGQPELSMDVLKSLGKKYADAHSKLPVYNLPAELMVKASMHLGNWEFEDAARTLEQLREMLNDEEKWKFMLSRQGTIEYLESKRETRSPFSKSPVSDDAIKLTKAEQKILKEIKESGTPDFAKVVHAVALDYDEPGSILDNMKPTNMRVTMKNARTVSSEIQRQAQESLERAGFPEEFSVWRTAGAGGRPNTGVVSVTTRKGGLGLFKGTVVEYRVSRSDVLTHGEGFLGNLQTYAEDELHVDIEKLRPVGSKLSSGKTNRTNRRADNSRLSSGKSSVLNDEEKKQISDILKKEFPGGISSAVGKMADYSGSRLQNNRDGQVSLNPQEKKAIEALENIGKIIDKRISESVSEKRDAGSLGESPEMQLLLEKEKAIDAANIYLRKIYRSTEDALDKIKKLDKQVRKSIVSNIYKIPKKTSNIDKEYSEHNNKISGSYLVQLLKDVRQNLTAGEYRAAENFTLPVRKIVDSSGREIMPRKIINFNYSNTYKNANNLHLTDLVSEIDMEFLELPENQPIINDITLTLNLADKISKNLIKKTEKEARKISELSDAEILDFIEKEIYVNVESFGSKTGSMKYRRNILTGRAFTMGPEVVSKELPEFDSESSLRALNEKSAKDLLIKTLREIFTDNEVIQTSDKSFKARQNTTIELDEKLAKGIAPQYVAPSSLSVEEAIRFYGDKAGLISKETRELNKQRESYVEQGLVPKMQYGVENEFEKQTAKLKRELFVQALGELGIAFTKPENVRKTVVRLYMQRLNDFYQWTKGLGLKEGEDGKNRPDETIDFNKNNPYEYVGGEKDGRHAATIPLMNKVLSLIPENLTNGSLVVELPAEEAERLTRLGASETFGYLGKHKIISKYFADAWVNPLERGGSKLSIIWRLVPGKNRAHAHNILNGKVLITQEPAPTSGPTDEWESVALHEIVHGVEYANPVVTALEWMYWVSRRKAGEALTTLRRKDGTEYRNKNEKGVVDEWGESYAGKIYEGRPFDALEIFTTGMQSIFYENTSKNADPSHRAFTIGVLVAAGNGKPQ